MFEPARTFCLSPQLSKNEFTLICTIVELKTAICSSSPSRYLWLSWFASDFCHSQWGLCLVNILCRISLVPHFLIFSFYGLFLSKVKLTGSESYVRPHLCFFGYKKKCVLFIYASKRVLVAFSHRKDLTYWKYSLLTKWSAFVLG